MRADFSDFYLGARDDCLRAVAASVGDAGHAEELVAEAFARAWQSWRTVRRHPAPQAWVVRTALNTHVSWWRRWRREIAIADVQDAGTRADQAADDRPERLDAVTLAALRRLPRRQREVLALRVFLDLDTRATAAALGIAEGTVTAHLARATAALRAALADYDTGTDIREVRS